MSHPSPEPHSAVGPLKVLAALCCLRPGPQCCLLSSLLHCPEEGHLSRGLPTSEMCLLRRCPATLRAESRSSSPVQAVDGRVPVHQVLLLQVEMRWLLQVLKFGCNQQLCCPLPQSWGITRVASVLVLLGLVQNEQCRSPTSKTHGTTRFRLHGTSTVREANPTPAQFQRLTTALTPPRPVTSRARASTRRPCSNPVSRTFIMETNARKIPDFVPYVGRQRASALPRRRPHAVACGPSPDVLRPPAASSSSG